MNNARRMIVNVIWILLGIGLIIGTKIGGLDSIYFGFGSGMAFVGLFLLIRDIFYKTNDEYREKTDVAIKDERNRYIRQKSWAWVGYIATIGSGVATLIFMVLSLKDYMLITSYITCFLLLAYCIIYFILSKKY